MYTTNNPLANQSPEEAYYNAPAVIQKPLSIFILPAWIYQAFTSKFSLNEIHEYAKLRQVASLEDLAHLEILRRFSISNKSVFTDSGGENIQSFIRDNWEEGSRQPEMTDKEHQEVKVNVNILLQSPGVVEEALARFKALPKQDNALCCDSGGFPQGKTDADIPFYRVVILPNTLYIVVEEGFLSHIEEKAPRLAFLTQVLKSAYAVSPISLVNRSVWYEQYLKALVA